MKLARYLDNGVEFLGIIQENSIKPIDISNNMNELIINFEKFSKFILKEGPTIPIDSVTLLSPIKNPLQDVICLGLNYIEHAIESMKFKNEKFDGKREEAVYFSKRVNECNNPNGNFFIRNKTNQLDYEVELALIIGKDCSNVSNNEAMDYVFGYCIANDISARDLQSKYKQWYVGKSLEGSFAMGPYIATKDSINVQNLNIKSFVNGELRQNSNISQMIFDIPYIISDLSRYFTIKAGSIISTGTPSGVGMGFNPPQFLKSGDSVKCVIDELGELIINIKD